MVIYPSLMPLIGAEGMCCENAVLSKMNTFHAMNGPYLYHFNFFKKVPFMYTKSSRIANTSVCTQFIITLKTVRNQGGGQRKSLNVQFNLCDHVPEKSDPIAHNGK